VLLGVTGGIGVYKAVELLRLLVKAGADVHVAMTPAATKFVQPLTFRELSYHPVAIDVFDEPKEGLMQHLYLADGCDVVVVAPATANTLAKIACGIADNALCTVVLAATVPVVLAPAMDSDMWANPITQANVKKLRELGYHFVGPEKGQLARGNIGWGRLSDPEKIFDAVVEALAPRQDWNGLHLLVTAGPTREPLDPVRYISNRSSGKMGYAIAAAAQQRGARVTLVSGPTALEPPAGVELVRVTTAVEMREACLVAFSAVDACIKAAAPADYRVEAPAEQKIKKASAGELTLQLIPNPDILAELGRLKGKQVLVGFAAETENLLENARDKLQRKNCDMLVANDVTAPGAGFDVDTNAVKLLTPDGRVEEIELTTKTHLADILLDRVLALVKARKREG
jgi:phosphopantothenoylcysteine decarboxylase/phosphopantothenate--cysteine ligase